MISACNMDTCINSLNNMPSELSDCLIVLYLSSIIYTILGIYLYEVMPKDFGVKKNLLFFLNNIKSSSSKKSNKSLLAINDTRDKELNVVNNEDLMQEIIKIEDILKFDDTLTKDNNLTKYPLVCYNLSKQYETNSKKSLNNFNIVLNENEIFGLLGPNGAGKTTFFSLLTGMFSPTEGNAWVAGQSILDNITKVQEMIGYCPQFDILWSDLSIEQHLHFYCMLKNIDENMINNIVNETLQNVHLLAYKDLLIKELSGGMRRRLSLGISLVGNPKVVFLDEPTTGLDPENKRQIWEILSKCKTGKSLILTTHIMEEAEILSDRLGIIFNGELKCLGTKNKIKNNYGRGFKLTFNLQEKYSIENNIVLNNKEYLDSLANDNEIVKQISLFIKGIFSEAELFECYKESIIYIIPIEVFDAELLYNKLENQKSELKIDSWAISQMNLEDIFIKLTENEI